jgi:hypothetical protein
LIIAVDTLTGRESGLFHEDSGSLIVADALGAETCSAVKKKY